MLRRLPRLASVTMLATLAHEGADGRRWYQDAHASILALCDARGWDPDRFVAVLAITSPRVQVARNWAYTVEYMETGARPAGLMSGIWAALVHYERTGEIRGPKTGPFARACLGDLSAVVLDVWMAKAFGIDQKHLSNSPRVHRECVARVRRAAKRLGWEPAEMQAAVWTAVVRRAGRQPSAFPSMSEGRVAA